MQAVFANPKTDFVFKRIFGNEAHKSLLIALLESLLELDPPHRIVDLEFLSPEQRLQIEEFKLSIIDVKCRDATGRRFVVEMQVLNVEGFEKRVVYNSAKAYVSQLGKGENYTLLADVIGVTICNFNVWPEGEKVPMLSRWRMQEQHGGALGLSQIQHVFLELPKYKAAEDPQSTIDRWAFFFREAENLDIVPPSLSEGPFREALEVARIANFKPIELEIYDRERIAEQDARGALSLSRREGVAEGFVLGEATGLAKGRSQGREEGLAEGLSAGLRVAIRDMCGLLGIELTAEKEAHLQHLALQELEAFKAALIAERRWPLSG